MRSGSAALHLVSSVFPVCSWSEHNKYNPRGACKEAGELVIPVFGSLPDLKHKSLYIQ